MKLLVLHLSDIHFQKSTDPVLKRVPAILAATRPYLPNVRLIIVVVSGDIAQSGSKDEYRLATRFFADLRGRMKGEASVPLHFVVAPGNHDCDFRDDQSVRHLVVGEILKKSGPIGSSFLNTTTKVQKEFFSFRRGLHSEPALAKDDPLWSCYRFSLDHFKVSFDVLNASWISTRYEQQGDLLFPYERYAELNHGEDDLRICVLHHPFNWYSQSNYREFRSFVHRRCDFILTGHEHHGAFRETEDAADGSCIYVVPDRNHKKSL